MDFKLLLASNLNSLKGTSKLEKSSAEKEKEVDNLFQKYYTNWKKSENYESFKVIPKFYYKLPSESDQLRLKLREESRSVFLHKRSQELLDNDQLKHLYTLLQKHQSLPLDGEEMINYEDYLKVSELVGEKCKKYFLPSTFCKLVQKDRYGRVSIMDVFNYIMRKVWFHQTRIGLSLYDVAGQGYLRESDMESYIIDLFPTLSQLNSLEKSFHQFYVCTAVRKFFFFLDPLHTGQIKIQDILACTFLDDLLDLRDDDLPIDQQRLNWFSTQSVLRVYGIYLNLDKDHNGMLSKSEMSAYGMGTLTPAFIERLFQECLTYEGEMDYKTYLNFMLAIENQKDPQSLHYFFKILDIHGKGYLDAFTLNYFFRSVQQQMEKQSQEPIDFRDIKDEIFDMVKPADSTKITLQDLINCGQGDVVISILIDLNGFWTYETREGPVADILDEPSQSLSE